MLLPDDPPTPAAEKLLKLYPALCARLVRMVNADQAEGARPTLFPLQEELVEFEAPTGGVNHVLVPRLFAKRAAEQGPLPCLLLDLQAVCCGSGEGRVTSATVAVVHPRASSRPPWGMSLTSWSELGFPWLANPPADGTPVDVTLGLPGAVKANVGKRSRAGGSYDSSKRERRC